VRWLNPFDMSSTGALAGGVLTAVFIYWGWDTAVTVNEESKDTNRTPGVAAVLSTLILVGIYVIVTIAAQAFHGPDFLAKNSSDVLGALGKDARWQRQSAPHGRHLGLGPPQAVAPLGHPGSCGACPRALGKALRPSRNEVGHPGPS
jgi:amino acid transporter